MFASIAELCDGGKAPIPLPSGETRTFLEDGDEVIFRASAKREGFATIGCGDCAGRIIPRDSEQSRGDSHGSGTEDRPDSIEEGTL